MNRRHLLALLPAALVAACTRKSDVKSSTSRPSIAIAYALGGKGDQNYNDAAAKALPRLRELFDVKEYSPLSPDDYGRALATLAGGAAELIICVGFIYDTYVNELAPRYGSKVFCVLDGAPKASNALGIQFRVQEASALAGVIAADRSTTGKLGFVGGSDIPPIAPFVEGFELGARRLRPHTQVLKSYIGSGAEAFTNAAKGRDHALRLIGQGADVLFHAAGQSGAGVIAAARERKCLAVGVDVDQQALGPGTVITSVLKRLDAATLHVAEPFARGIRPPAGVIELGLAEGAVDITPPQGISPRAQTLIAQMRQEYGAK